MHLSHWDWLIIGVYAVVFITIGLRAGRKQHTSEDYFLAGRKLRWPFIGASIYAANISTEHFVGLAGTVSTVAMVEQGLPTYDRDKVHHFRLSKAAAEDVFRTLAIEKDRHTLHTLTLQTGSVGRLLLRKWLASLSGVALPWGATLGLLVLAALAVAALAGRATLSKPTMNSPDGGLPPVVPEREVAIQ